MVNAEDDVPDENLDDAVDYRHRFGLITPKILAKVLGVTLMTLKLWRMEDRGPNYVRISRRVWYLYDDVLTWLARMAKENEVEMKTMTTQRRDYSKMTPHEDDIAPPGQKQATAVAHEPVPPPTPDDVNQPPRDPKYSPDGTPDHPPPLDPGTYDTGDVEENAPIPPEEEDDVEDAPDDPTSGPSAA